MVKLITPVQYEQGLDGLNQVRPLTLVDESKAVIALPFGCINPPSKDRPAEGRLLRCDNQGAILSRKPNHLIPTDIAEYNYDAGFKYVFHTFNRRIKCFNIWVFNHQNVMYFDWDVFWGGATIKDLSLDEVNACIHGQRYAYFKFFILAGGVLEYYIQGFY